MLFISSLSLSLLLSMLLSMFSADSLSPEEEEDEDDDEFSSFLLSSVVEASFSSPYADLKLTLKSIMTDPCFMPKMCTSSNGTLAKSAIDSLKSFSTSRSKSRML